MFCTSLTINDEYDLVVHFFPVIKNVFLLATKQARKACQRLTFLLVSKARTNILYIFRRCTFIVLLNNNSKHRGSMNELNVCKYSIIYVHINIQVLSSRNEQSFSCEFNPMIIVNINRFYLTFEAIT